MTPIARNLILRGNYILNKSKVETFIENTLDVLFTLVIGISTWVLVITFIHVTWPDVEFFVNIINFFTDWIGG